MQEISRDSNESNQNQTIPKASKRLPRRTRKVQPEGIQITI